MLDKVTNGMDVGGMLQSQLDAAMSEDDVSFTEDVEPILGSTMGGFVSSFTQDTAEGAIAFAVTDTGKAEDLITENSDTEFTDTDYNGTTYHLDSDEEAAYAFIDDFLVLGTEQGIKDAIDASGGDSLADDSTASDALDSVPDDTLFAAYVDPKAAIDGAIASGAITQQQLDQTGAGDQIDALGDEPVVISGGATADSISFQATGPAGDQTAEMTDIVSTLPSGAWLAFGAPDVGQTIATSYEQFLQGFELGFQQSMEQLGGEFGSPVTPQDIPDINAEIQKATGLDITKDFGWIGNMGAFVQGSSPLDIGGGVVIETDDAAQATATLAKLRNALGRERGLKITPTDGGGFTITPVGSPLGAEIAVRDDKVVFAAGGATVDDVLEPSETLADNDRFSSAADVLGDDLEPSVYVDLPTIFSLVESTGAASSDPDYQAAQPYLSALDYMIAGGSSSDDGTTGRFVIGLKEPSSDTSDTSAAAITP
jgi:hypothetical protein